MKPIQFFFDYFFSTLKEAFYRIFKTKMDVSHLITGYLVINALLLALCVLKLFSLNLTDISALIILFFVTLIFVIGGVNSNLNLPVVKKFSHRKILLIVLFYLFLTVLLAYTAYLNY